MNGSAMEQNIASTTNMGAHVNGHAGTSNGTTEKIKAMEALSTPDLIQRRAADVPDDVAIATGWDDGHAGINIQTITYVPP